MRYLFLFITITFFLTSRAQKVGIFHTEEIKTMEDAWGRPIRPQTTYKVEGTPYFPENYTLARISFTNGKFNSSVRAKINLYDNTILYQNANGEELVLMIPVNMIEFYDSITGKYHQNFRKGHTFTDLNEEGFYQVLDSGRITLLKHVFANYRDFSPYGTAVITRTFEQKSAYYYIKDGIAQKTGKNNESLFNMMNDKKEQVDEFIRKNKIKLKSDMNLAAVIHFYNSLFQKSNSLLTL